MSNEKEYESRPAFGMIAASRVSASPPGAVMFDSDMRHQRYVMVRIAHAERARDLNHDWIHSRDKIIEVQMSEAQWASFVSSMNTTGVPCTLKWIQGEEIEDLDFKPRLEESMKETHAAAQQAFGEIVEAARIYEETPSSPTKAKREAWATLRARINNAVSNVDFAGKSLGEHAENVVQKARADIEAMVTQRAAQLGVGESDRPLLLPGEGEQ